MPKTKKPPVLKYKNVKGRVKTLRIYQYHEINVYVMQFDGSLFAYFLSIEGETYFNYVEMWPEEGKKKLTDDQIKTTVMIVSAGAETTIDTKLGIKPNEGQVELAKIVTEAGNKVFKEGN